jgi:transcriptional regulator with XRE-family HTH domain
MSAKPRRLLPPVAGRTHIQNVELDQFARRLHQKMTEKGLGNSDLARIIWGEMDVKDHKTGNVYKAAKNRDRIGVYLAGKGYPEPATMQKIADALGVTKEWLAPELTAAAIDRERPEFAMAMVAGHLDKVHVQINALLPLAAAAEITRIFEKYKTGQMAKHLVPGVDIDVEE